MDRIKEIYDAPVRVEYEGPITKAIVTYNNQEYIGTATLHPDDEEFSSKIVGGTIAHMHAIIDILKYKKRVAFKSLEHSFTSEIDATKALETYKMYRDSLEKLYKACYKYIKDQERAYQSIRIHRQGKSN